MNKGNSGEIILEIYLKHKEALVYFILTIISIAILGTSLSDIQFLPGLPIRGTNENLVNNPTTVIEISSNKTSSNWIFQTVLGLGMILVMVLIIIALLKRINYKLVGLITSVLVIIFALFNLLPKFSATQQGNISEETTLPEYQPSGYLANPIGEPPAKLFFWVKVGMVSAGIFFGGWLVTRVFLRNQNESKLAAVAETALQAISNGANLGGVIIRCYLNMEEVVSQERGIERDQSMTPYEFETHLIDMGIPSFPIQVITNMFEKARYGNYHFTEQDELDAVRNLAAIQKACHLSIKKQ